MAYSSGTFSLVASNPVVTGTTISSTWANDTLDDIADNGLTLAILKNGTQTVTANIPFAGFRLTGIGAPSATGDALREGSAIGGTTPAAITVTQLNISTATPMLLTSGQLVTVALTSQTVGGVTLTIPDFASVADEFVFKTLAQTLANKTLTSPAITTALTTGSTTFALVNTTATTLNFAGAATTITMGATTGTMTVRNATLATKTLAMTVTANTGLSITDGTMTGIFYASTGPILSMGTTTNHSVQLYSNNAVRVTINGAGAVTIAQTLTVTNNIDLTEMTAPAGVANTARLFAVDNGSGKTVLKVIFGSGVAQQIAIEA